MNHNQTKHRRLLLVVLLTFAVALALLGVGASPTFAQSHWGGEANLILPDLSQVDFFGGINGHNCCSPGSSFASSACFSAWRCT